MSDLAPSETDAQNIKLKEIIVQGLPSPFYLYSYDDKGFVTTIKFASGHFNYDVYYENNRIKKLVNNIPVNKDTLLYHYTGTLVNRIDLIDQAGIKYQQVYIQYDQRKRLIEVLWKNLDPSRPIDLLRKLVFTYNSEQNLASYEDYRNIGLGLQLSSTYLFSRYDTKVNVDRNRLFKDFFDHYLYLPQVVLQKNNPLEEVIKAGPNEYLITYDYTYAGKLPLEKRTLFKATQGSQAGTPAISSLTTYTYY